MTFEEAHYTAEMAVDDDREDAAKALKSLDRACRILEDDDQLDELWNALDNVRLHLEVIASR